MGLTVAQTAAAAVLNGAGVTFNKLCTNFGGMGGTTGACEVETILSVPMAGGVLALILVFMFTKQIGNEPDGPPGNKVTQIRFTADKIHSGAVSFLHAEYKMLAIFVLLVGIALALILIDADDSMKGVYTMLCFYFGAVLSAGAGYLGMHVATLANSRTAWACNVDEGGSLNKGLRVAFKSGSVMGLGVVGFGILGLSVCFALLADSSYTKAASITPIFNCWEYISGFGFGASSIALFARVGGGVYTKAADVGADLVGKVEAGLPEDHPFNSACIADNVGDNVGDVAGMGADLFESYVGSIIAAATLAGTECMNTHFTKALITLPFWVAGFGIIAAIVGIFNVRAPDKADGVYTLTDLLHIVHKGIFMSEGIVIGLAAVAIHLLVGFDTEFLIRSSSFTGDLTASSGVMITNGAKIFGCIIIGLVAGELIGQFTEYCTDFSKPPTQSIAKASNTGPATVIIQGLGVGMISVTVPALVLVVAIIACDRLAALYGIAIAAVGMLSTLGVTLATDAYGPVADNAGGIAEMCSAELPKKTREYTDALDAMGNTTAATGKGFAIGSAVLTAAALMAAFMNACNVYVVNVRNPLVICGMLLGAMLPYIFAAITMLSVGQSAQDIMQDVRDQFKDKASLKVDARLLEEKREEYEELEEDKAANKDKMEVIKGEMDVVYQKYQDDKSLLPDYDHTIRIATEAALNEMMIPGALAIFSPAACGFLLGPAALAGLLIGALTSGFMLAIEMANAGGAWDNAKKWVEGGDMSFAGESYKKGTPYHDATVVGDTVGDPFKDTSGPALNVLIKLMTLVSLVLAPAFKTIYDTQEKVQNGFETKGVISGVVIIVVVGAFCLFWQKRSNAKNAKDEQKQPHSAEYWKAVRTVNQLLDNTAQEGFDGKLATAVAAVKAAKWSKEAGGGLDCDSNAIPQNKLEVAVVEATTLDGKTN